MNKFFCAGLLICSVALMGCRSLNTGIEQNADGSYTVTRTSTGFLRVYGSVYNCTASGSSMNCTKIDGE